MTPAAPDTLADLAERAARRAGALLLSHFERPSSGVERKTSRTDLVSDADREAESVIVEMLRTERPADGIVAEEGAGVDGTSGLDWIIDPLDGTTNFLWRVPQWAVSVAVHDASGPLAAVVHDPPRGETYRAARGLGAWRDGVSLNLAEPRPLAEALVGTGFNYDAAERSRQSDRLTRIITAVRDVRRFGAAALDLAWVAEGRIDAFFETGLAPWDWAAGRLLVEEAGGAIEVLPARGGSPECVMAAPPTLMGDLLALVRESYR